MLNIVFMVDDDLDDREIFLEAVRSVHPTVAVTFATDGAEALRILSGSNENPDVIFLDYNMPRMTGVQCLRALKADARLRTIPVIMYTTSGDREEEKVALLLGADHYMKKTANFRELCAEIQRLLSMVERQKSQPGQLRG